MVWNWEQPDWPSFRWDAGRLAEAERVYAEGAGVLLGSVQHLAESDVERLTVASMSTEAVTTSAIEGEVFDRESVQSSIRRHLGLAAPVQTARAGEEGIAALTVDLYRNWSARLTDRTLFAWHRMVMRGRTDLNDLGAYRTHASAMQVVSQRGYTTRVHFEAPPSRRVRAEMAEFILWFARTGPTGTEPLTPLTRAAVAHLYFESIHPFEDGNGRVGRAIAEMALAQSRGRPTLTALAATILKRRSEYYAALEAANKSNEITEWLAWFAGIGIEAQRRTIAEVEFLIQKTLLLDRVADVLNHRQLKVLLRVLEEGPDGFTGGLSAGKYSAITKAASATSTRDLAEMVDLGILKRTGERKGTRYHLVIPLRPVARVTVSDSGRVSGL